MKLARISRKDYISENVSEELMTGLDDYFIETGTETRFLPLRETETAGKYTLWLNRAVSELRPLTKDHLMKFWRRVEARSALRSQKIANLDEALATDMVETILNAIEMFTASLNGILTRSKLYHYAGLQATLKEDHEAIEQELKPDTSAEILAKLRAHRAKLLERPWLSGPFCHELFDVPYRCNLLWQLTTASAGRASLVFIEKEEEASLKFMTALASTSNPLAIRDDAMFIGASGKMSALLLGQASPQDIMEYRDAFASIRESLAANTSIGEDALARFNGQLRSFKKATADVESSPITELLELSQETRRELCEFLVGCVFLVRKGEPLDRMYDEPDLTLPGVLRLETVSD